MRCSDHTCDRDAKLRGFCTMHYQHWRRSDEFVRFVKREIAPCTVKGCCKPAKSSGICNTHYQRARRDRLRVACTPPRKMHEYSLRGRCIHCGFKRTRIYIPPALKLP